jgi:hypothetical protein
MAKINEEFIRNEIRKYLERSTEIRQNLCNCSMPRPYGKPELDYYKCTECQKYISKYRIFQENLSL